MEGDIEDVDGVMRITEIRVRYHIRVAQGKMAAARRAVEKHPAKCPAAMSVEGCIRLKIEAEYEAD
ncbi:MAG TPA: hypothetical protein VLV83_14855 [Acidobacteriota bacterium]|nr:hypothetical protein [Acidobacteriota bacterium]